MARPKILLADDHALLLEAFASLLEPRFEVVGAVTDGRAALEFVNETAVDVVVIDVGMPILNGLDAARQIKAQHPSVKIVFLTVNEDPDLVAEAFRVGASAYLPKSTAASDLFRTIEMVLDGRERVTSLVATENPDASARASEPASSLTSRQREVLQLLAEGRSMKEAAAVLDVTARTIAFHKYRLMQSLGLETNADIVQYAIKHHLIEARA